MSKAALTKEFGGIDAGNIQNGCEISRIAGEANRFELVMNGAQGPGWVGRLAAGLARHRTGIVRGEAEKVTASSWRSCFELKSAPFATNPLNLDFMALAATDTAQLEAAQRIALLDFVIPSAQQDGTLIVEVTGIDRLGFLGDILDYFSMRCLFPVKMTIETVSGQAVDRFWLRGVGGSRPSESISAAIKENLERLLVHTT